MRAALRRSPRRVVSQPVLMMASDTAIIGQCTMLDVSAGGARLKLPPGMVAPDQFVLLLSKFAPNMRRECVVMWRHEQQLGVRFIN